MRWIAGLIVFGLLAGCAGGRGADRLLPRDPPSDLALDAIVFVGDDAQSHHEPSRFVLEPGGVLRAAVNVLEPRRVFPGHARRLTREQVAGLWRLIADAGLIEESSPARVTGPGVYRPARGKAVALVTVRFEGRTRSFRATLSDEGDAGSADAHERATRELIARLEALAWTS